ncbi:MAG: hypothetical protein IJF54_06870 [Clostridia bacterium]|nr:hypothetical protein [Clostridia bacterium]
MALFCLVTIIYVLIFIFDYPRLRSAKSLKQAVVYWGVLTVAYVITFIYCLFWSIPTLPSF